jgi:hypothetical protein
MNDAENQSKQRDRKIAENESVRQASGAVRVSGFAIAIAVLIGIASFGWIWLRR